MIVGASWYLTSKPLAFPSAELHHHKSRLRTPENSPLRVPVLSSDLLRNKKAKSNANTRTLRPDKCLVVIGF